MKFFKSTTAKAYTVLGHVIPDNMKAPLGVTDEVANRIINTPVIASLLKSGGVMILDKYTDVKASGTDEVTTRLQQLSMENAKLADKIKQLESKKSSKKDADTDAKLTAQAHEIAELKARLAEADEKYTALETEANEKIAQLQGSKE